MPEAMAGVGGERDLCWRHGVRCAGLPDRQEGHRRGRRGDQPQRTRDRACSSCASAERHRQEPRRLRPSECRGGAAVKTNGLPSNRQLGHYGYTHDAINIKASGDPANVTVAAAHRAASLLKRWWLGTLYGAASPEHFDAYLEEYVFRFNRRTSTHRGLLFYRVLEQAVDTEPAPYRSIGGGRA